ncbi:MAG: glycoside hydrolase family 57 protein [Mariprofundaceae bacterium]
MSKLSVVFCWHMHQPFYRDSECGRYALPWVYLHAMKEYTDMAAILEQVPNARAVVNFVPSLTLQIEDYAQHLQAWVADENHQLADPLLQALANRDTHFDSKTRAWLLESCFRLNHERNLHRYPAYSRLWHLAEHAKHHDGSDYLGSNYFADILTWYHLGWIAESERDRHFVVRRLIEKGHDFSWEDRRDLLGVINSLVSGVTARYKTLMDAGKVELSTTPYAHPIIPLQLDFNTARETVADALIPERAYPGGEERAKDHINLSIRHHQEHFGKPAVGCWPAEGAVSDATTALLDEAGFSWCATGEAVLHHSLGYNVREHDGGQRLYRPWRVGEQNIACFFRDDHLSDLIGFEYSRWNTSDAIANFMHELAGIHHRTQGMEAPCVAIIMDGENAWEHYHENGIPFLTGLYQAIAEHEHYELTTFSDYLDTHQERPQPLEKLTAGSWVYGNLATWIGDHAKTRAWELLIDAKIAFDASLPSLSETQKEAAMEQLRICEGSDWCWWFGDYNPGAAVRDFDRLYRQQLRCLYQLIGQTAPDSLNEDISKGGGSAEGGGTMRRNE